MKPPSPAVAHLCADLIAAIEAVCAARARDIAQRYGKAALDQLSPTQLAQVAAKLPQWPLLRGDVALFNGTLPAKAKRGRPRKERGL